MGVPRSQLSFTGLSATNDKSPKPTDPLQPGTVNSQRVLGINFFKGSTADAVTRGLHGGLVVVPAAPALVDLDRDLFYRDAVLKADLVIPDSGFMVLVWRILEGERINRISGLAYLRELIHRDEFRESSGVFWILPTTESRDRTLAWLDREQILRDTHVFYVAPQYPSGPICDAALLGQLQSKRPAQIVIGLGGGTQERLGLFITRQLSHTPGIHCLGAAIGFLSGDQVRIPDWTDRIFLGWLFRCFSDPKRFIPRYLRAAKLGVMLFRHRRQLPPIK